jgi:hypothetical protein
LLALHELNAVKLGVDELLDDDAPLQISEATSLMSASIFLMSSSHRLRS